MPRGEGVAKRMKTVTGLARFGSDWPQTLLTKLDKKHRELDFDQFRKGLRKRGCLAELDHRGSFQTIATICRTSIIDSKHDRQAEESLFKIEFCVY